MEDILKILAVVGILLYGFVQRVRKEGSRQSASYEDDLPEPEDMTVPHEEQEIPHVFMSDTVTEPAAPPSSCPKPKWQKKQVHQPLPDTPTPPQAPDITTTEEDAYRIRSAEEARKAIIWGEILQRKY